MINHYFPTAVFSEINLPLAEAMLPVARKYLDDKEYVGNRWSYKNTYEHGLKMAKHPDIQPYNDYITEKSKQFLRATGYDPNHLEFVSQIFVSEMFKGDRHARHTHPKSVISGILYLQVPENSAPILFLDPRPHRDFVSLPKLSYNTSENRHDITIHPRKGLFLCWESWLPHVVPKSMNENEGRITMVFNLAEK
jgi:hypothetical protein